MHGAEDVGAAGQQRRLDLVTRQRTAPVEPELAAETGRRIVPLGVGLEEHVLTVGQQREIADTCRVDEEMQREQRDRLGPYLGDRRIDCR